MLERIDIFNPPEPPTLKAARARAQELAKAFQFNEVIKMLDSLIKEVKTMPIASRFSPDRPIFSTWGGPPKDINPMLVGMSERDHKRWQLEHDLGELKNKVLNLASGFEDVVLDIEATKID